MNALKYFLGIALLLIVATGCKKNFFGDTSFVSTASQPDKLSVLFDITQDNTGLVTITPNGEGVISYNIYFGDTTASPVNVLPGKNVKHIYPEGIYTVKIVGYNVNGKTAETTQQLTVSFKAPENLKVKVNINKLTVNISASALYETLFKVYFGDSINVSPIPFTPFLEGQTVTHIYPNAGTYILRVVALSGGASTTNYYDTIKVAKQIDLPVTFDDPNVDYTMTDFGGNSSSVAIDPTNTSNHVMKSIKTAGAQTWAGTTIGTGLGFANVIPITATSTKMTIKVYSPAAGLDVKLKIEDHTDPTHSVETDVHTTVANQWETLQFDFRNQAPGTAPLNTSYTFDKASVFFDFGNPGSGSSFYFDDVIILPPPLPQINLPLTFDNSNMDYTMTDFGGNNSSIIADPVDISNKVLKSIKTVGAQTWAGTTLGTALGFASVIPIASGSTKMSMRIYSPAAGIDIKLKIEDHNNSAHSVETDVLTTVANQWETLVFDFSNPASGTTPLNFTYAYDKASVFFDFGNAGDGRAYYVDDIKIVPPAVTLSQINLPVTFDNPTIDYTVTDFGSNQSSLSVDPTNNSNNVMKSIKTAGAQTWAGTTIGTALGFASPIPIKTGSTKMSVRVYSPAAGIDIKLKIEDHKDGTHSVETDVLSTVANQWETLVFDFSKPATGTAALNTTYSYDKASIFFDFGNSGNGKIFYWDDVKFL